MKLLTYIVIIILIIYFAACCYHDRKKEAKETSYRKQQNQKYKDITGKEYLPDNAFLAEEEKVELDKLSRCDNAILMAMVISKLNDYIKIRHNIEIVDISNSYGIGSKETPKDSEWFGKTTHVRTYEYLGLTVKYKINYYDKESKLMKSYDLRYGLGYNVGGHVYEFANTRTSENPIYVSVLDVKYIENIYYELILPKLKETNKRFSNEIEQNRTKQALANRIVEAKEFFRHS